MWFEIKRMLVYKFLTIGKIKQGNKVDNTYMYKCFVIVMMRILKKYLFIVIY